jgi:hypothetical protein
MCSNKEKITHQSRQDIEINDIKRQLAVVKHNMRIVLETNEAIVKKMEILQKNMESR